MQQDVASSSLANKNTHMLPSHQCSVSDTLSDTAYRWAVFPQARSEQSSCVHFHFHLTLTPSPVLIIILTLNRITAIQRTHLWQVCKAPAR